MPDDETVNVRYMVDDVDEALAFYTEKLGFEVLTNASPAFADVWRGNLRLLLAGPTSSAGRPMPDGTKPGPGGWNRIHFIVEDIDAVGIDEWQSAEAVQAFSANPQIQEFFGQMFEGAPEVTVYEDAGWNVW